MTKKYVYTFLQPFGTVASSHQPRRGIYRDESNFSIRLRLGCSVLPFPVRLVCPILLFNRRGWVWALQPPCAVDRLPCGLIQPLSYFYLCSNISKVSLPCGLVPGVGSPPWCGLQCCRSCGSPRRNDTIMKPHAIPHCCFLADLSFSGLSQGITLLCPTVAATVCVPVWHSPIALWGCQMV